MGPTLTMEELLAIRANPFKYLTPRIAGSQFAAEGGRIGYQKGSKEPGRDIIKTISIKQCEEIAEKKLKDLNANTVEQGVKIIVGSAKSMGIEVTG